MKVRRPEWRRVRRGRRRRKVRARAHARHILRECYANLILIPALPLVLPWNDNRGGVAWGGESQHFDIALRGAATTRFDSKREASPDAEKPRL